MNAQVSQTYVASPRPAAGQENAPIATATANKKPAASKKRKSTDGHPPAPPVDLDSIDIDDQVLDQNCDQVRRKINLFLDSGAMTKTAFAGEIGISPKSLNGFLGVHGAYKGSGHAAYVAAWQFFKKREIAGIKLPVNKKAKTSSASGGGAATTATVDISDVVLPGEDDDAVEVYDTCDDVRKKIDAHLKKPGVTQAQFCRDIYAQLKGPERPAKPFQSAQLARFRNTKGPLSGAKSPLFYGAYVFFEKLRVKEGKPKSKRRMEMEEIWGEQGGLDRRHDSNER